MQLLEILLETEMRISTFAWYARVPSPSNVADGPSRGEVAALPKLCMQMDVSSVVSAILATLNGS